MEDQAILELYFARDELAIKPGLWLYAQIKSVSITA